MAIIGRLDGEGSVRFAGERFEDAEYSIIIERGPEGRKSAYGFIVADADVLWRIFSAGARAILELEDGRGEVEFAIARSDLQRADIVISGPVPGY